MDLVGEQKRYAYDKHEDSNHCDDSIQLVVGRTTVDIRCSSEVMYFSFVFTVERVERHTRHVNIDKVTRVVKDVFDVTIPIEMPKRDPVQSRGKQGEKLAGDIHENIEDWRSETSDIGVSQIIHTWEHTLQRKGLEVSQHLNHILTQTARKRDIGAPLV